MSLKKLEVVNALFSRGFINSKNNKLCIGIVEKDFNEFLEELEAVA